MTRVRAQLVSRQHMAEVAAAIGLGSYLRLSRGEDKSGLQAQERPCSRIPWRPCWARCFLDGGLEPVRAFVAPLGAWAKPSSSWPGSCAPGRRWATINRRCRSSLQAERAGTPVYRVKSESGPDHRKRFLVEVRLKSAEEGARKATGARHGQHQEKRRAGCCAARAGAADGCRWQSRGYGDSSARR